jgi:hypothetical protein
MIIFPLITTWMWFQIITASPLPSSGRPVEDSSDANASLSPVGVLLNEVEHDPGRFHRSNTKKVFADRCGAG